MRLSAHLLGYGWRSVRANGRRLLGMAAAIMLGVALIVGTFVATDTVADAVDGASAGSERVVDLFVVDRRSPATGEVVDDVAWIPDLLRAGRLTPLPIGLADDVAAVEEVASVTGVSSAPVELLGPDGAPVDGRGSVVARSVDDTYGRFLIDGRLPVGREEVILDRASAAAADLGLGDPVGIAMPDGQVRTLTLVGTVAGSEVVGSRLVGLAQASAADLLGATGGYSYLEVRAAPGVSAEALEAAVSARLEPDHGTITGTALRDWTRRDAAQFTNLLRSVISVAGVVALVLGSFVISNTFTVVLASRARELSLLRCVGASGRQLRALVLVEAALVGLLASAAGVVLGVLLAMLLARLIDSDDVLAVSVAGRAPVVTLRTLAVAVAVGVGSAVLSALGAVGRATRMAPMAGLGRDVLAVGRRQGRVRIVFGAALLALGGSVIALTGASGADAGPMVPGALALVLGLVAAGPVLVRWLTSLIVIPFRRLFGVTGELAGANAGRVPRRTSATVVPLSMGLALLVAFAGFTASVKDPVVDDFDATWRADLHLAREGNGGWIPAGNRLDPAVQERLEQTGVFAAVVGFRNSADFAVAGHGSTSVTGVDAGELARVVDLTVLDGSLDDVADGAVAISTEAAADYDAAVGSVLALETPTGPIEVVVRAVFQRPVLSEANQQYELVAQLPEGRLVLSPADFEETTGRQGTDVVLAATNPGVTSEAAAEAATAAVGGDPTVRITTRAELRDELTRPLNGALRFYYGLLALLTGIAFFGVANTVALSVHERRRELGLLQLIGLDRRRVRATIRLEAVIMALAATLIGLPLGVVLGRIFTMAQDLPYRSPLRAMGLVAILAVAVVLVVVELPVRRVSRLPILRALKSDRVS